MGIIGLDFPAAFEIAEKVGIEVNRELVRKLKALERAELAEMAKKREEKQDA